MSGGGGGPGDSGIQNDITEFPVFETLNNSSVDDHYDYSASFSDSSWGADFFAQLALAEFAKTDWQNINLGDLKPPEDEATIKAEIGQLVHFDILNVARNERFQEIIDQADGLVEYFAHILMLSPAQPNTRRVIEIAHQVGLMVAIHFKYEFGRARPQQIYPGLVPMITPPPHPSFPSGHALQSHLIALALEDVVPEPTYLALVALADRIGKNREFAGVHYESDTSAGKIIAEEAFKLLNVNFTIFKQVSAEAKTEHQ